MVQHVRLRVRILVKAFPQPSKKHEETVCCAGHPHTHIIHDWEVQAAYRHYKHRYGAQALDQLTREYGENIPKRNPHFLMGTMASHMRTFIVIGLLRSPFDPQELARQKQLF